MRKNCLMIVIDCLRADKIFESELDLPNISSLISEGISFDHTIASTSTTTPSFTSLLTGMYPPGHGIRSLSGFKLKKTITTLPVIFKKNNYSTYAQVTGPLLPQIGLNKGFDRYKCRKPEKNVDTDWYESLLSKFEEERLNSPWFFLLHLFELHKTSRRPRIFSPSADEKYNKKLVHLDSRIGELLEVLDLDDTLVILHADHGQELPSGKIQELFNKAKNGLRKVKGKIGLGIPRMNPYIGHGFQVYDSQVRIPLILVNKDLFSKSIKISNQIRQIDVFPTLVDVLDLQFKGKTSGRSVTNLVKGKKQKKRWAYMEACGAVLEDKKYWRAGVRTEEYKYIWAPYNKEISDELYDLKEDPLETQNIAKKKPQTVKKLKKYAEDIRKKEYLPSEKFSNK